MKARGESALLEGKDQRRAEGSLCQASRWKVGGNEREGRRVVPGAAYGRPRPAAEAARPRADGGTDRLGPSPLPALTLSSPHLPIASTHRRPSCTCSRQGLGSRGRLG